VVGSEGVGGLGWRVVQPGMKGLVIGATEVVTIGPEGYAEWRAVASDVTPVQVTITTTGAWHLYDPAFTTVANGKGSDVACLPAGNGLGYLTLFGDPGQTITVAVH
jgi:hypothetical protein